jgi:hypothetical protein
VRPWAGDKLRMINRAKIISVLKSLVCIKILQTQRCKQNKNWINGSADITILKLDEGILFFTITFFSLQVIMVHFNLANTATYLKQQTKQRFLRCM